MGKMSNVSDRNRFKILSKLKSILDGTFLTSESFLKQYTFVLFVSFLTLIYIAQNFYADKILLSIEREKDRVRELRFEYVTTSEHLSKMLQASQLKEKLKHHGIKPSVVPPQKIIIRSSKN